jgi:hypothetical protein
LNRSQVENQVAELEEEKGNLQLKLVEMEELTGKRKLVKTCKNRQDLEI